VEMEATARHSPVKMTRILCDFNMSLSAFRSMGLGGVLGHE